MTSHNSQEWFDIQLFAQEKTEEPTAKRKGEARSKGQIAKSSDLNNAVGILAAFIGLKIFADNIYRSLSEFVAKSLQNLTTKDFTLEGIHSLLIGTGIFVGKLVLPIIAFIMFAGVAINYFQVGWLFVMPGSNFNISQFFNPLGALQKLLISKKVLIDLAKSALKIIIVGYLAYQFVLSMIAMLPDFQFMDLSVAVGRIGTSVYDLGLKMALALLILAFADYYYQRWDHNENLKMSKEEIKEESKQQEGNPQVKAKIREKQRAMALRRMMQSIPKADVVITNPTHFAIALQYDSQTMSAPVVLAKGQDYIAMKIKELARKHNVAVVENKPLAQALYKSTEMGDIIPGELFQAVAEVLAYVYRLKRRR